VERKDERNQRGTLPGPTAQGCIPYEDAGTVTLRSKGKDVLCKTSTAPERAICRMQVLNERTALKAGRWDSPGAGDT